MSTDTVRIEFATQASSYGLGPFHPALRTAGTMVMYWPNITFDNEDQAFDYAALALKRAWDAANAVAREWNIFPA